MPFGVSGFCFTEYTHQKIFNKILPRRTKVLDRKKMWWYYAPNNFITQMHLSRNQYIRKYQQRVVGWCKTAGKAVSNSFCEQCTELGVSF